MKKRILLSLSIILFSFLGIAQQTDTISILSYNLLNFPSGSGGCGKFVTPNRQDTLARIIEYMQPDIFVACEVESEYGANLILDGAMNPNGNEDYKMAPFIVNTSSGNQLQNVLYYNKKLKLKEQYVVQTLVRDINHYVLYYNDPSLFLHEDTVFYDVFMTHLKASDTPDSREIRAEQTDDLRSYISTLSSHHKNIFVAGDMNVYLSSEEAYQNLTENGPFVDPINTPGIWHENQSFSAFHTQSTRVVGQEFDCGVTGGLDDRFDQILVGHSVMNGNNNVKYIQESYQAVGNDGSYFNKSLSDHYNSTFPDGVMDALFYMSDHLPVYLETKVTSPVYDALDLTVDGKQITCKGAADGSIVVTPKNGTPPYTYNWLSEENFSNEPEVDGLEPGTYCVTVMDSDGEEGTICYVIDEVNELTVEMSITQSSSGKCNGKISVSPLGGVPPYTVFVDDEIQEEMAIDELCAGVYTVTITDDRGCEKSYDVSMGASGMGVELIEELTVFPNPANKMVTLNNLIVSNRYKLKLSDLEGRVFIEENIRHQTEIEIDVSQLNPGLYFLNVENSEGGQQTIKIVVGAG